MLNHCFVIVIYKEGGPPARHKFDYLYKNFMIVLHGNVTQYNSSCLDVGLEKLIHSFCCHELHQGLYGNLVRHTCTVIRREYHIPHITTNTRGWLIIDRHDDDAYNSLASVSCIQDAIKNVLYL